MTTRVLIDAVNVRATGPLALVRALVPSLMTHPSLTCTGLIPEGPLEALDWPHGVDVVPARIAGWTNRVARVGDILWRVDTVASRRHADVTLSLGDIGPILSRRPSVLLLHNALLVGPVGAGPLGVGRYLFRRSAMRARRILVQSPVMAEALFLTCGVPPERVEVIPHPPPEAEAGGRVAASLLADRRRCKLLYLAAYYAHKRHDLLPAIVRSLRNRGLAERVRIYVTIADTPQSAALLAELRDVDDVVINLGELSGVDAMASLAASDALLHLSDAESYGMTLIEALRAGRAIVAPALPYARWLCGDAARYFAAGDAESAAGSIAELVGDAQLGDVRVAREHALQKLLPTWEATAHSVARVLQHAASTSA